jgi:hypothetical protein
VSFDHLARDLVDELLAQSVAGHPSKVTGFGPMVPGRLKPFDRKLQQNPRLRR